MLPPPWDNLPQTEVGLAYLRSYADHRCDLDNIGLSTKRDPARYHFRNQRRARNCIFQYTLSGEGWYHDVRRQRTESVPAGTGFLVEIPSQTSYGLPTRGADGGDPEWQFVYFTMAGDAATYHVRRLVKQHGPILPLSHTSLPVTIMLELYQRAIGDEETDELTINVEIHRFLLELGRSLRTPSDRLPEAVIAARDHIEQFLANPDLSVDDLADAASYSRYHFTRLFKLHMGVTPYQYLLQRRIRRALDLLTTTSMPIKQIASEVGFANVSWFCNAFRQQMQATPTQVRSRPISTSQSSDEDG